MRTITNTTTSTVLVDILGRVVAVEWLRVLDLL